MSSSIPLIASNIRLVNSRPSLCDYQLRRLVDEEHARHSRIRTLKAEKGVQGMLSEAGLHAGVGAGEGPAHAEEQARPVSWRQNFRARHVGILTLELMS